MHVFTPTRSATFRRTLLLLLGAVVSLGLLACEGPAGPEGLEGPQGEQGPQGPDGTDPSIINLDLTDHVNETTFDRGTNTLTQEGDTLKIQWGATLDTTITSVTIADSQYAEVYVRVPGAGFQDAPIRFEFDGTRSVSNVVREADPFAQVEYDLLEQMPSPSRDSFFTADAVGGADRRYYTAITDQSDFHEAVVEPGEFTAMIRAYGTTDGSVYESGIAENFSSILVPFDSDLSDASVNNYPNANTSGEVNYEGSTTDLSAIRNSVGADLRLEDYELQATKQTPGFIRVHEWEANPRSGQVEVRAAWSRDSINVAGVMTGVNYGRDRTIYTQKIPVEMRIAIVGGDLAAKMRAGESVPFSEIQDAARR
ncbi:collagen-like protein [Salinibacter grassmerensis]|uniref:collagen-like protein n=1 Tax=Salinibacter grassmerensis TaxID=3040353 RepID=UPI0021E6E90B|nr:collagen-like protein [Salinibacter grassmerensis]